MTSPDPAIVRDWLTWAFRALVLWYVFFVAGTIQYRRLKNNTVDLILKYAGQINEANADELPGRIYTALRPEWEQMVRRSAWFFLGNRDLLPTPATVENVEKHLGFSPQWVKDCLLDKRPDLLAD